MGIWTFPMYNAYVITIENVENACVLLQRFMKLEGANANDYHIAKVDFSGNLNGAIDDYRRYPVKFETANKEFKNIWIDGCLFMSGDKMEITNQLLKFMGFKFDKKKIKKKEQTFKK